VSCNASQASYMHLNLRWLLCCLANISNSNVCTTLRGATFNYATVSRSTLRQYTFCWRHNESLLFFRSPRVSQQRQLTLSALSSRLCSCWCHLSPFCNCYCAHCLRLLQPAVLDSLAMETAVVVYKPSRSQETWEEVHPCSRLSNTYKDFGQNR